MTKKKDLKNPKTWEKKNKKIIIFVSFRNLSHLSTSWACHLKNRIFHFMSLLTTTTTTDGDIIFIDQLPPNINIHQQKTEEWYISKLQLAIMQKEALQIQYNITLSLSGLITWNFYRISHPYIKNFTPLYPIKKKKVCF